jgi:hypothetical protein
MARTGLTAGEDEDGAWSARALSRRGAAANAEADRREAAIADLREAPEGPIAESGPPQELTLTVSVA